MTGTDMTTTAGYLAVLALMLAALFVMVRPLRTLFFSFAKNKRNPAVRAVGGVSLEVVALCSLAMGFPTGAFGYSSAVMLLGFALALALLPDFTRPAAAVAMVILAYFELPRDTAVNLLMVAGAYVLLKAGLGLGKWFLGVDR